jgi:hypothetical protein
MISFACFLVATNNIFRPDEAIYSTALQASSSLFTVLYKLMM